MNPDLHAKMSRRAQLIEIKHKIGLSPVERDELRDLNNEIDKWNTENLKPQLEFLQNMMDSVLFKSKLSMRPKQDLRARTGTTKGVR